MSSSSGPFSPTIDVDRGVDLGASSLVDPGESVIDPIVSWVALDASLLDLPVSLVDPGLWLGDPGADTDASVINLCPSLVDPDISGANPEPGVSPLDLAVSSPVSLAGPYVVCSWCCCCWPGGGGLIMLMFLRSRRTAGVTKRYSRFSDCLFKWSGARFLSGRRSSIGVRNTETLKNRRCQDLLPA